MKFVIKLFFALMMLIVTSSFSKINEKRSAFLFLEFPYEISVNTQLKFELATDNLNVLNNRKPQYKENKDQYLELKSRSSYSVLSKRKSKSYRSKYNVSFYKSYKLD